MQLRTRPLKSMDRFLDPRLFGPGKNVGTVQEDGTVLIRQARFSFTSANDAMPVGTSVVLRVTREGFFGITDADQRAYDGWCRIEHQRLSAEADERRSKAIAADAAFNEALAIPFPWQPAIRIVLSGLLSESNCDGMRRNSVHHVMFKEPVHFGRIKRKAGEFLCSTDTGRFESSADFRGAEAARVTCKQCLKMAKRFRGVQVGG